ncbi:peptide chain release factor 2 [Candidatus Schneideria nysicola]|uniref:peptide chain release factor 2 n=1 Tax=Candidatus Schneideria nysicola TaxID=1081631 RepID=UPI001CAA64C5|nr:peptide chain release factor 2 [Candidatus Schneideria nysicola]UAJ66342.1 peptide chain release factor 2 [Candidatus Schneideria nysicola]
MFEIHLIKNRIQDILRRKNILMEYLNYKTKKKEIKAINSSLESPNIWRNPIQLKKLRKELTILELIVNQINQLEINITDIINLIELIEDQYDEEFALELQESLNNVENHINNMEYFYLFAKNPENISDCYMDITAGSGGTEAQDWAEILLRMYLRWSEIRKFKTEIIEKSEGDKAGIKSATIKIIGDYAYNWMRTETGIHRLVRKSPFDSGGRRHTSFGSVFVYPEIKDNINITINPSDLRIDVYRASGAGGQHVNRTESAVRITHLPTKIVTQCQSDRSQHKNKERALLQLKAKLFKIEKDKKFLEKKILENNKSEIGWGNQIRSYILDDSRIKDLRTGLETRNIESVLDGNLEEFIKTSLKLGL